MTDSCDTSVQTAYDAAHKALSGRYDGNVDATALRVARLLCARQERHGMRSLMRLVQSPESRAVLVDGLVDGLVAEGACGGVGHARPVLDDALVAAARALWDEGRHRFRAAHGAAQP